MRTVEINIYKFKELDPKVKEKVISQFREGMEYPLLGEVVNEALIEEMTKQDIMGVKDKFETFYDLSYGQGSGCCFTGQFEYKNYKVFIKKLHHHYQHSNTVQIDMYDREDNEISGSVLDEFTSIYRDICNIAETAGYAYIEECDREENIIETIEINEYEFYQNGRIF